ncbi:MAG: hypothetical protein K2G70_04795, partial [Turicibacter sp.]|nr:hypothetical protein [Turicibacter sp.]
ALLNPVTKCTNDIESKGYLLNIKYLYVYQLFKASVTLPEWYVSLAKSKFQELERYFNSSFRSIFTFEKVESIELNRFLIQRIAWVYKGKFRVYPTTPLDYLPLNLKLKVYVFLYENEEDTKARCHLRSRISVTLAKLGHVELANFYSVYNWLLAQDISYTHFSESSHLNHSLNSQQHFGQAAKELVREEKEVTPVLELSYFYSQLLNPENMKYDRVTVAVIDLVAMYYKCYPQLEVLTLPLKTYLRTKDKEEFYEKVAQKRMIFIRDAVDMTYSLTETTLSPVDQDQLAIYNYLLRIIK